MDIEEKKRYNRHIILSEIGLEGQLLLKKSSVLVIGAGGLGCPVLQYLGASGVGRIGIVDFDTVSISNLHRQILFTAADIGKPKAQVAKERLLANNPFLNIETFLTRIDKNNALDILEKYNVVVDGSDNFATRYLINDACVLLNKPLVSGAIFKFEGQLSVFNYRNGPSYRCLFPDQPSADSVPTCSQIGVLGVLPGIIGTMQANETIKVILGREDVLSGKILMIDILANSFVELNIKRIEQNFEITELADYEDNCKIDTLQIDSQTLHANYQDYYIVDVRPKEELEYCVLPNSVYIPKEEIGNHIGQLPRNQKIVIYCHFGRQSQEVVELLTSTYGFNQTYNLLGGLQDWAQEIDASFGY